MGDSRATIQDVIRERVYNTSDENEDVCACRGRGWHVSDWDTWEPCPCHPGRPHPEIVEARLDWEGETT